ncbi:MAG: DUF4157 domain-containing protein [Anaerolineales bacterium]|nr:DUF4157 domain-containing protein [Anaerolineales bacterium]MCB9128396.1 DUF4157 domain-containing protein [Ardenticatenales bacterium]
MTDRTKIYRKKSLEQQAAPTPRSQQSPRRSDQSPTEIAKAGIRSESRPLDSNSRAYFEPLLGHDFSQVRIHTNAEAATAANLLKAAAFTVGHDLVFGHGQYAPDSAAGRLLLAHELTHVVQQGAVQDLNFYDNVVLSQPGDPSEVAAEAATAKVALGEAVQVQGDRSTLIARADEESWLDTVRSWSGNLTNVAGSGTALLSGLADASLYGHLANTTGLLKSSPVANLVASGDDSMRLAALAGGMPSAGAGMLSKAGNVAGGLGVGLGLLNFATANNNSERLQAGADTAASAAGLWGGPVGAAFSGGYAGGQLLDQGWGWASKQMGGDGRSLSDRGGDWLYDTIGPAPDWMLDMF